MKIVMILHLEILLIGHQITVVFYWGDVAAYNGIYVLGPFDVTDAIETIQGLNSADRVGIRISE